ncbi:MAG: hypothetical protein AB7S26_20915 [Sandaracinaceae bacterium]
MGSPLRRAIPVVALLAVLGTACGRGPTEETPRMSPSEPRPAAAPRVAWPANPELADAETARCLDDYRAQAARGFPEQAASQSFRDWYTGPFDRYVVSYNHMRERCDEVLVRLDQATEAAQAMSALQGWAHERMGQQAVPYEEDAAMFFMARYWTLGAACTYARCAEGPNAAWASVCRERMTHVPACPPTDGDATDGDATDRDTTDRDTTDRDTTDRDTTDRDTTDRDTTDRDTTDRDTTDAP